MKRYLLALTVILYSSIAHAADISGRVISLQGVSDVDTSNFTNLESKKFIDSLVVSKDKGLSNAVIFIEKINQKIPEKINARLDQLNSAFKPRVSAMTLGGELLIVNSDKIFHNVHGHLNGETIFIANLPQYKQEEKHIIDREGIISVKCEVHLDMQGYILALNNPYFAITDQEGHYSIKDLPKGEYNLIVWHELLGRKNSKIVVKGDKDKIVSDFTFEHITTVTPRLY